MDLAGLVASLTVTSANTIHQTLDADAVATYARGLGVTLARPLRRLLRMD